MLLHQRFIFTDVKYDPEKLYNKRKEKMLIYILRKIFLSYEHEFFLRNYINFYRLERQWFTLN
jgi:hypothetical protein